MTLVPLDKKEGNMPLTPEAAAAIAQAIAQILPLLNGPRSVVLEVDNNTSMTLTRIADNHAHGGFAETPTSEIPPQHADVFGSQSLGGSFLTGTEGNVTYNADGLQLFISWDNPFVGDTGCQANIQGNNAARFRWVTTCGVGNTAAHMRYELFDRVLANFSAHQHSGNPVLIQSRFGSKGNFELLVPLATGGLIHYARINDDGGLPWQQGPVVGTDHYDAVTMIQSNFGTPGNLEVIARVGDRLVFFFRDLGPAFNWSGPFPLVVDGVAVTGVTGIPALIQSRFGSKGNFELLVPLATGGLAHYFRTNDDAGLPWHHGPIFGTDHYDAVTMIQSNFGTPGHLEAVALGGTTIHYFFKDTAWNGPFGIVAADGKTLSVSTNPVLIQGHSGSKGNFELLAPEASPGPGGGIQHFWRDNDVDGLPWHQAPTFGNNTSQTQQIGPLTMIQSNFGTPGNLEVIARVGDRLVSFFRDSGPAFNWNGPFLMDVLQANWRFCRKCNAMFFDGFPEKGVCPVGSGHEAAGFNFVLPHDLP